MSVLVWNVRGLNKKVRRNDLKDQLHKWSPSLVGLVETKVKENNSVRVTNCFPNNWQYMNNYTFSPRGRIWIVWDPACWTCQVISSSEQQITITCQNRGGFQTHFSVIYGANYHSQRLNLWKKLVDISSMIRDSALAVLGDFNSARFTCEKI